MLRLRLWLRLRDRHREVDIDFTHCSRGLACLGAQVLSGNRSRAARPGGAHRVLQRLYTACDFTYRLCAVYKWRSASAFVADHGCTVRALASARAFSRNGRLSPPAQTGRATAASATRTQSARKAPRFTCIMLDATGCLWSAVRTVRTIPAPSAQATSLASLCRQQNSKAPFSKVQACSELLPVSARRSAFCQRLRSASGPSRCCAASAW